jgi:hypothetical protein
MKIIFNKIFNCSKLYLLELKYNRIYEFYYYIVL